MEMKTFMCSALVAISICIPMPAVASTETDQAENLPIKISQSVISASEDNSTSANLQNSFLNESTVKADNLLAERIGFDGSVSSDTNQLDAISKQVLLKEIELLKLNTRYRIESTRVGRQKPWRLFVYSLASNTMSEIGISHVAYARWKYWRRPALATKPFLRKGPICLLIGHSIIVGGVLIESTLDLISDRRLEKNGFDRDACRKKVIALKTDINQLLASRESAVQNASLSQNQTEVLKVEGKVLSDVKDCAVEEFGKLAVREKKIKTARNTANLFTFAAGTTGGYMGALGNLLAVSNRKPRLALPAGIGFVLSGSFIALTPVGTKVFSIIAAKSEKKKEAALLGTNPQSAANFDSDRSKLDSIFPESAISHELEGVKQRLEIYKLQNDLLDRQVMMAKAEVHANNKEFVEKLISNTIIGGTKIGWGTQLIVAGSAWSNTAPAKVPALPVKLGKTVFQVPIRPMKTPAQLFGRRVAQGATTFIPGPATAILDTLQARARGELRERNAKSKGTAAGQILAQRLKTLEEMEAKLK